MFESTKSIEDPHQNHDIATTYSVVWFKCFLGTRYRTFLLDVAHRKFSDVLLLIKKELSSLISPSLNGVQLIIDYLDESGRRIRLDSSERLVEAIEIYKTMPRNFVYLFCQAEPNKITKRLKAEDFATQKQTEDITAAIYPQNEEAHKVPTKVKTTYLIHQAHGRDPKFTRSIIAWDSPYLTNGSSILNRYQQQIRKRELLQQRNENIISFSAKSSWSSIDRDVQPSVLWSTLRRVDTYRTSSDPAWSLLNSHIDTKKKGYISCLTSDHFRRQSKNGECVRSEADNQFGQSDITDEKLKLSEDTDDIGQGNTLTDQIHASQARQIRVPFTFKLPKLEASYEDDAFVRHEIRSIPEENDGKVF